MSQKFLSPSVSATEIDQSTIDEGGGTGGAVFVGPLPKGPAFVPTIVRGFSDFVQRFGNLDPDFQVPYAVKNYLKNADTATVVRVLGHDDGTSASSGYTVGGVTAIVDASGSAVGTTAQVLAVVHHSGTINVVTVSGVDQNNFVFRVGSVFAATASFLTSSANYIEKVLNTDPTLYNTYGHYLYQTFRYARPAASASYQAVAVSASLSGFLRDFEAGKTTWVKSQPLGGLEFDLFRFWTIGHGRATNDEVKVMIANVKQSPNPSSYPYGTFDVVVRAFGDSDLRPSVLETFTSLTLDPDSPNYMLRRIGDGYEQFNTTTRKFDAVGTFPIRSKYIRVELNEAQSAPPEALPWGFRGYPKMTWSITSAGSSTQTSTIPALPYSPDQKDPQGNYNTNVVWGVNFVSGGIDDRMRAFPDLAGTHLNLTGSDADFSLKFVSGTYENGSLRYSYNTSSPSMYQPVYVSASLHKFTMPFFGGFDGWDLRVQDPTYLANDAADSNIGVVSLKRGLDTISNSDIVDMNVLTVPGVHALKVTDYARNIVNARRDVLYVMDITGSTVDEAITQLKDREIDDNYCAAYYPDVKINDRLNKRVVRVAPSVVVAGALSFSDKVGQVFFAPAGMNRGGLSQFDVVDIVDRLNFGDRDNLYSNRINPITGFAGEGIMILGQKTLQAQPSALDRINVRRLLIFAKKVIISAARGLLFEPNNASTWQRFVKLVNPILDRIRQNQGIERFRVVMDSSTVTPDLIDRYEMNGKIFLQPTKAAEFIDIGFVITNAGVTFSE